MAQSFGCVSVHLVFSTKARAPLLDDAHRDALHEKLSAALKSSGCHPEALNSVEDHVHLLFKLSRTAVLADVVRTLKSGTSAWLRFERKLQLPSLWQGGYAAFSVSTSQVPIVTRYIARQREHHTQRSYKDEYLALLKSNGLAYDERYVWD